MNERINELGGWTTRRSRWEFSYWGNFLRVGNFSALHVSRKSGNFGRSGLLRAITNTNHDYCCRIYDSKQIIFCIVCFNCRLQGDGIFLLRVCDSSLLVM